MRFVVLRSVEELNRYRLIAAKYIDVLLPLEYLQRSKVVAYVRDDGAYCGGMVFVMQGPFRVLESIPDGVINRLPVDQKDVLEITGFWLDRRQATSKLASFFFWIRFYIELVISGKKGFVYAYCLRKKHLEKLYANGNPIALFKGATKMQEGMSSPEEESVEFVRWPTIFFGPVRKPQFLIRRFKVALLKQLSGVKTPKLPIPVDDYSEELEVN